MTSSKHFKGTFFILSFHALAAFLCFYEGPRAQKSFSKAPNYLEWPHFAWLNRQHLSILRSLRLASVLWWLVNNWMPFLMRVQTSYFQTLWCFHRVSMILLSFSPHPASLYNRGFTTVYALACIHRHSLNTWLACPHNVLQSPSSFM